MSVLSLTADGGNTLSGGGPLSEIVSTVPFSVDYNSTLSDSLYTTLAYGPGTYGVTGHPAPLWTEFLGDTVEPVYASAQFLVLTPDFSRPVPTPEPSTWVMLAIGFAMLGAIMFRQDRRKKSLPCLM